MRGRHGDELHGKATAAMEMLGIEHLAERPRTGLSGGEAQRVSIARAVAVDPSVIFLDEPMASLDPPTRRGLLADLERIFSSLSTAVVWVTHDTEEALAVADLTTFLVAGEIVQHGPTTQVFNNPATQEVADYLGLDQWFEGVIEPAGEGTSRLVLPGGAGLLCVEAPPGPAVASVHPEDVLLFLEPPVAGGTTAAQRHRGDGQGGPDVRPLQSRRARLGRGAPRRQRHPRRLRRPRHPRRPDRPRRGEGHRDPGAATRRRPLGGEDHVPPQSTSGASSRRSSRPARSRRCSSSPAAGAARRTN